MIIKTCIGCGVQFQAERRNRVNYHSPKCYYENNRGDNNGNWKGGKTVDKRKGYVYVHQPNHPNATKNGYVYEHRLIAEKKLGRYLKKTEDAHHINGNPSDNYPSNIIVLTHAKHRSMHANKWWKERQQ